MSIVSMTRADFQGAVSGNQQIGVMNYPNNQSAAHAYEYKGPVISTVVAGDSVLTPPDVVGVSITVIASVTGSAQPQITTSPLADVVAGTATWLAQGSAITATSTQVTLPVCTAFRINVASGTYQLTARAQ